MKHFFISIFLILISFQAKAGENDSLKYSAGFSTLWDLSDTYGNNASILSGEFKLIRSWYGVGMSFGYFQSLYSFSYDVYIEERDRTISIPINEVSIMKNASLFLIAEPINGKVFATDVIIGIAYANAQSLMHTTVSYSYDLARDDFNYLIVDYELYNNTHFGYLAGLDLRFKILKRIGIEIKTRFFDMSNGGSFFFTGAGLFLNF